MKQQIESIKILEGNRKEKIINKLKEQFGIEKIPGKLLQRGKERIFLFTGEYNQKEIENLSRSSFIERVGIYVGKIEEEGIRLSIEGSQILKDEIKKNIVELNEEEKETWMMGHELLKESGKKGFVIIKYQNNMLGTGKASEKKITNFIPKSRRLKDKTIEK
jgi:NOL1/NOP2/fmu family ribosome biogenesis protein